MLPNNRDRLVMVLADGTTYSTLDDCKIVLIHDTTLKDIEATGACRSDFETDEETGTQVIATFEEVLREREPEISQMVTPGASVRIVTRL